MIAIFTKPHHVEKIVNFLNLETDIKYWITSDKYEILNYVHPFDIGISYCCPYKLRIDRLFYNYHPGPLPEYGGVDIYARAIKNGVTNWGVTLHIMTDKIDEGNIINQIFFGILKPYSTNELGTIAHHILFKLFRETINDINKKIP